MNLTIRDVEVEGRSGLDVRIEAGRIAEIGVGLPKSRSDLDGYGGALIPGLCDHHIHLLAQAAKANSVSMAGVKSAADLATLIARAIRDRPPGAWVRVLDYHEVLAGELTRRALDILSPDNPLRIQHQTGSLWILNSRAIAALGSGDDPPGFERDTGRVWRGDAWLRSRIGSEPPSLAPLGRQLAAYGITALTDASVTTDAEAADLLARAHRCGDLPQRLTLMSGGVLAAPADGAFAVGPVKVLLDDHALPEFDDFVARIARARTWGRAVAVHCVTAAELALTLAAFEAAGAQPGDRIEHGSVIPLAAIGQLKALGLTVVTQSGFIRERGDRYMAQVDPRDRPDLYRCASLLAAGVPVAGSSDAPYASPDPWVGIAAAMDRRSAGGLILGAEERVSPATALGMYFGDAKRLTVGVVADLCLLDAPLAEVLAEPSAERVQATLIDGRVILG